MVWVITISIIFYTLVALFLIDLLVGGIALLPVVPHRSPYRSGHYANPPPVWSEVAGVVVLVGVDGEVVVWDCCAD